MIEWEVRGGHLQQVQLLYQRTGSISAPLKLRSRIIWLNEQQSLQGPNGLRTATVRYISTPKQKEDTHDVF